MATITNEQRFKLWKLQNEQITKDRLEEVYPPKPDDPKSTCPVCQEKAVSVCNCSIGSVGCSNGHNWYYKDDVLHMGNGH